MTQLTNLDTTDITDWLTRVTQTIDRSLRDPARTEAAAALRAGLNETKVGLHVLTQLALLEDCLRVAHLALEADGVIEEVELTRITDLVRIAAPKFFAVLPHYEAFGDGAATPAEVVQFLRIHRADTGPFGFANGDHWRGLHLARRVEQHTRNASPLREHERMLARVMDEVFGGRASEVERSARRRLRDLFEPTPTSGLDPRTVAFCRPDGPEVFASIAHGSQIHDRDSFDVESIHADARDVFHRQVERATTPEQHSRGFGRTVLLLGDSGAGKTHLLRALRAQTHSGRRGYVGYMQMTSEVGDYGRYVLRNLIDSLERPYDAPALSESGLMYLSNAVAEGRADIPRGELENLRAAELSSDQLDSVIGTMIDRVVRTDGLAHLETDLLHALFLLQRRDPALQRRVVKFLRCESLGVHDRMTLGGLTSRDQPEDPLRTIRQLGTIMYELSDAALVLLVDQIEDTIPDGQTATRIQQAFDNLRSVSDSVPSAVVVIACLTDVYDAVKPKLSRSVIDRLELDPAPVRLASLRETPEIEQMLLKRLEHLYSAFDVPWRDDEPFYPFTSQQIEAVNRFRARDCLARFREFHNACIEARSLIAPGISAAGPTADTRFTAPTAPSATKLPVDSEPPPVHATTVRPPLPPLPPLPSPAPEPPLNAHLERAWNDALVAAADLPEAEDDAGILALIEEGLRAAAFERGTPLTITFEQKQLVVTGETLSRRLVVMCNRGAQGGHLGNQLEALRTRASGGTIPFAIRSSDWKFRPKTRISEQVGELLKAGGRTVVVEEHDLRAIIAARTLATANPPGFAAWWRTSQKLAALRVIRELLDLDRVPATPQPALSTPPPSAPSRPTPVPMTPAPISRAGAQHVAFDPERIRLGTTTTMRAEPIYLPLEQVKTHVAFLGTTGSGKTTAALSVTEQLLERGVSVLLVDRKGDLARYASDAWWQEPGEHAARRSALRDRIDVALYTPGNSQGRPLRLPLIPPLHDASSQDREQLAKFAASGLAAMMGYGTSSTHRHKMSILQCAISLHATEREVTVELLSDTISRPDPELLQAVGALERFFAPLSEDLQSLQIQRGSLIAGDGDILDVAALLPPAGERPRLSIINTSAITEIPVLQFWISRLLVELARLARRRPSTSLQAAAFFDEADAYIPAVGAPPTKEPMFDLLRRARSGGIGILLASQNPGDFDYKARDLIGSWLVGKVGQDRAIEKMRNLLGAYPNVAARLAAQVTGQFFVLSPGKTMEVRCDRSLMNTEQMTEQEVTALAQATRR